MTANKLKPHSLVAGDFKAGQLPAGPQGPQGDRGTSGADGISVTSATVPSGNSSCPSGGSSFTAVNGTTYACNGAPGVPGPGYEFTTATGSSGPTLSTAGTYFVVVKAGVFNSGSGALAGECGVHAQSGMSRLDSFVGAVNLPGGAATSYAFSGMLHVASGQAPATTDLACTENTGGPVSASNIQWWVSPVGS